VDGTFHHGASGACQPEGWDTGPLSSDCAGAELLCAGMNAPPPDFAPYKRCGAVRPGHGFPYASQWPGPGLAFRRTLDDDGIELAADSTPVAMA
jgi:hypothetical protein